MDLSKPIGYRGMPINTLTETGRTLKGVVVENADYSDVVGVGYTEKRAAADGIHASDVYLGPRGIDLSGFIYAVDLSDLFDTLHLMRAAFSPTAAYQESPGDRGFLPLTFSQPTGKLTDFPEGVINLMMLARPERNLRFTLNRDRLTDKGLVLGAPGSSKAGVRASVIGWAARLVCKDPRVYVQDEQQQELSGTQTVIGKTAINRGDYETPMHMSLIAADATAGKFTLTGLNNVDMEITLEAGKSGYTYRWFGDDRVLMTQKTINDPLVLRMDLVKLGTANRKPMVSPGGRAYQYSHTANLAAGSRLFWSEAFA